MPNPVFLKRQCEQIALITLFKRATRANELSKLFLLRFTKRVKRANCSFCLKFSDSNEKPKSKFPTLSVTDLVAPARASFLHLTVLSAIVGPAVGFHFELLLFNLAKGLRGLKKNLTVTHKYLFKP